MMVLVSLLSCSSSAPYPQLMTLKEYYRLPGGSPYILHLESNQGSLLYYGALHTFNPQDPQIRRIEELWNNFHSSEAYCEGNVWPLEKNRSEAIKKFGEQGLLRFLSARDKVTYRCLDPSLAQQTRFLIKKRFLTYQIKIYFILRRTAIERRLPFKKDYLETPQRLLRQLGSFLHLRGPVQNLNDLKEKVAAQFIDLKDWSQIPWRYFYSRKEGKFLARIHQELTDYRNRVMLERLIKSLKRGERVFALVGRSHVVSQEQILLSQFSVK